MKSLISHQSCYILVYTSTFAILYEKKEGRKAGMEGGSLPSIDMEHTCVFNFITG